MVVADGVIVVNQRTARVSYCLMLSKKLSNVDVCEGFHSFARAGSSVGHRVLIYDKPTRGFVLSPSYCTDMDKIQWLVGDLGVLYSVEGAHDKLDRGISCGYFDR